MLIFKPFTAIILLLTVLANSFNYLVIQEGYAFNKAYISSVLCSNKDNAALHCNGKCFLDIKLKELEQKNKQASENLKHQVENLPEYLVIVPSPHCEKINTKHSSIFQIKKPIARNSMVFQPPPFA